MRWMRNGALVLPLFAVILGAWCVVLLLWDTGWLPKVLSASAVVACLLTGLALGLHRHLRPPRDISAHPDLSLGAVLVAFAVAGLVLGAEAGPWLLLISAATAVLGIVQLGRERVAERHALRGRERR